MMQFLCHFLQECFVICCAPRTLVVFAFDGWWEIRKLLCESAVSISSQKDELKHGIAIKLCALWGHRAVSEIIQSTYSDLWHIGHLA